MFRGEGRELLEQVLDTVAKIDVATNEYRRRAMRNADFVAGRQWPSEVIQALRTEGRPALTFNLSAAVIRELTGAMEGARRRMRIVPTGADDILPAEALNRLWQRLYRDAEISDAERLVWEWGLIMGEASAGVEIEPLPERPGWWTLRVTPLSPIEVMWDTGSRRPDRSDAQFVVWWRWVSLNEIERDFPEVYRDLLVARDAYVPADDLATGSGYPPVAIPSYPDYVASSDLYTRWVRDRRFFDWHEHRVRLIHVQYIRNVERDVAITPEGRTTVLRDEEEAEVARRTAGIRVVRSFVPEVWWIDAIGTHLLEHRPQPFVRTRFTIVPFCAMWDLVQALPRGVIDDLVDPQMELNKRYSHELDLILRSAQPGAIVESDAVEDVAEFERQTRTPGATAVVLPGGLAKVQERQMPQLPAAVDQLGQRAVELFNRIAGFSLDILAVERGREEPVGTAVLRHQRMLQSVMPIVANFRKFQRSLMAVALDMAIEAMPDAQLEALLGEPSRFKVRGGLVSVDGQVFSLGPISAHRYQIEFDTSEDDTTSQMLTLQMLVQLAQTVPIDPLVITEFIPVSRDHKERLRQFVQLQLLRQQQMMQQQMALQAAQAQMQAQRLQDVVNIEAAKVQQRAVAAEQKANTALVKTVLDFAAKVSDVMARVREQDRQALLRTLEVLADFARGETEEAPEIETTPPPPLQLIPGAGGSSSSEQRGVVGGTRTASRSEELPALGLIEPPPRFGGEEISSEEEEEA